MTDTDQPLPAKAMIAVNVAAVLTAHFEQSGELQGAFARRAGIAQSSVSKYASGTNTPNTEQLVALAAALDVSLDLLVLGERTKAVVPLEYGRVQRFEDFTLASISMVKDGGHPAQDPEPEPEPAPATRKVKL